MGNILSKVYEILFHPMENKHIPQKVTEAAITTGTAFGANTTQIIY
jgi:hypothetical protein